MSLCLLVSCILSYWLVSCHFNLKDSICFRASLLADWLSSDCLPGSAFLSLSFWKRVLPDTGFLVGGIFLSHLHGLKRNTLWVIGRSLGCDELLFSCCFQDPFLGFGFWQFNYSRNALEFFKAPKNVFSLSFLEIIVVLCIVCLSCLASSQGSDSLIHSL